MQDEEKNLMGQGLLRGTFEHFVFVFFLSLMFFLGAICIRTEASAHTISVVKLSMFKKKKRKASRVPPQVLQLFVIKKMCVVEAFTEEKRKIYGCFVYSSFKI